jgi:hypothetical protein
MKSHFLWICYFLLGMFACKPVPGKAKIDIFRYIDIGNNYRLLLGDDIGQHLNILTPTKLGYKLSGEGYGDATSIYIEVSAHKKINNFQFLYKSEITKQSKVSEYNSIFGAPLQKNNISIWRDHVTELQVFSLKDGSLIVKLLDITNNR